MMLAGKPLVQHVIDRVRPQVDDLLINANGDASRFAGFGCDLVPDGMADFPGPLAGILAGLQWTRENRPDADWLVSCACDCPFLPSDLVSRLVRRGRTRRCADRRCRERGAPSSGGRRMAQRFAASMPTTFCARAECAKWMI